MPFGIQDSKTKGKIIMTGLEILPKTTSIDGNFETKLFIV